MRAVCSALLHSSLRSICWCSKAGTYAKRAKPSLNLLCAQLKQTSNGVPMKVANKLLMLTVAGDQTLWLHIGVCWHWALARLCVRSVPSSPTTAADQGLVVFFMASVQGAVSTCLPTDALGVIAPIVKRTTIIDATMFSELHVCSIQLHVMMHQGHNN